MKNSLLLVLISLIFVACQNETKTVAHSITAENDTLTYHYDTIRITSNILPKKNDSIGGVDSTYAFIKYPIFDTDSINNYILNMNQSPDTKLINKSYRDIATQFIHDYNDFMRDYPTSSMSFSMDLNLKVLRQTFNYMCIERNYADYTGGAHGNYQISYFNFNPKTLKPIELDTLILPNKKGELLKIAEEIFRKNEKINANEPLDKKFFFDKGVFSLPDNFYVSTKGLVFLYNIYEIKPYSEGITELVIPINSLKDIIKPNTILSANTSL